MTDTVDSLMAQIDFYGQCRANWQGLAADSTRDSIRAAIERLVAPAEPVAELDGIATGCVRCNYKSGRRCKKFGAEVPDGYTGEDCPEWSFDGVPF